MSVSREDQKKAEKRWKTSKKEEGKRAKAFETRIFYGRRKQKIQASGEKEESRTKKEDGKI